jgi:cellulose synthase/poly-beta-1,6-N-acetylglucosamine synthase-like glycosyltransferase
MIMEGLTDCNDEDVILISDIDEIPNPDAIKHYVDKLVTDDRICVFQKQLFYYYLNYKLALYQHWNHGNITTFGKMREDNLSPQEVRNFPNCKKIGGGVGIFPILVVTRLS